MGLFKRKNEVNQYQNDYFSTALISNNYSLLIDERQAMQLPVFKSCMQLIENTIASLPIDLKKKYGENIEFVKNNKYLLMLKKTNSIDTAATLKKQLIHELLLYGVAYLYVNHNHLHVLKSKHMVEQYLSETGFTIDDIEYIYNFEGTHKLEKDNVIRFDLGSKGVLSHDEILETALNAQLYNKSLLKNGTFASGIIKASTRLTEKAIKNLRDSWQKLYSGAEKNKTIILEEGLDYQPLQNSPEQLQLNQSDSALTTKICMLFNVSESLISDKSNKYNSLSTANTAFLQTTIAPLLNVITETLNKYFFKDENMQFAFDTSQVLKATESENIEATKALFDDGIISFNEARKRINYSVIEDKKDYYQLNIGQALRNKVTGDVLNINTQITKKYKDKTDSIDISENTDSVEANEKEVI